MSHTLIRHTSGLWYTRSFRCSTVCMMQLFCFSAGYFLPLGSSASPPQQLQRHTGTLSALKKLLLAFFSFFCYYYWAFGLQHGSAFSWVCSLSINYRLQNRQNFSGAAYWISKRSGAGWKKSQWCHQHFKAGRFHAAHSPPSCPLFMSAGESNERCIIVLVFITAINITPQSSFSLPQDPICSAAILWPWIWFRRDRMCCTKAKNAETVAYYA